MVPFLNRVHVPLVTGCSLPTEIMTIVSWLGNKTLCASSYFAFLPMLAHILPPYFLVSDISSSEDCQGLLLTAADSWIMRSHRTPTVQQVLIINTTAQTIPIHERNLNGRRVVVATCNKNTFSIKTEFEVNLRFVSSTNLKENLSMDIINKDRTVILGTFNCSICSATGPIYNGNPTWIDGVELKGVTGILNTFGIPWSIIPVGGYGEVFKDGSLEVGKLKWMLSHGYVDIGFCMSWSMYAGRAEVINPWSRLCPKLLVPKPRGADPFWLSVFLPLPVEFWAILVLLNLLTGPLVFLLMSLSPLKEDHKFKCSAIESCFKAVTFITHGMGNHKREAGRLQLIHASWSIFILITSAAYSSSLASILSNPSEEEVPQTLAELIHRGFVWVSGIEPLYNVEYYFKTQSGVDEKWANLMVKDGNELTEKTAILGQEIDGIFFMDKAEHFPKGLLEEYMVSHECLAWNHVSILTRKMSPYFEFMTAAYSKLAESGVLMKMLRDGLKSPHISRYIIKHPEEELDHPRPVIPLGLMPLRGAFYILAGGELIAFLLFIIERKWKSLKFKRNIKRKVFPFLN